MKSEKHRIRFHYAWVIAATCFLSVALSLGFNSSPNSLYLSAITEELGLPRSLFSIGTSFRFVTLAVVNLFFGRLVHRLGTRKLMAMGFVCLFVYDFVASRSHTVWGFYLANVFFGLGEAWTTTSLVGIVVERWFTGNKGTVMGVILAANGLGGVISSQLLTRIIYSAADGWRRAYLTVAALMLAAGLVVLLLMRDTPECMGLQPLGTGQAAQKKQRGREWVGMEAREVLHRPYFYACAVCVFLTGLILQAISGISSAHMKDQGLSAEAIANAMAAGSVVLMVSKTSTGALFDRFGLRATMLICSFSAVLALLLLADVSSPAMALVYRFFIAFGLPLETIMVPLIAKECFGQRSYAFLMGLMVSCNTLGYSIGAPLMNYVYDVCGTYSGGMLVMAGVMVVVAVIMQLVITAAHKERQRVEADLS